MFTLFAIVFFFIGILLFGIGLLGEYVGRIYQEVQRRPRFLIRAILEKKRNEQAVGSASAVVFAYHDVGVRCLSVLLAYGVQVPLVVTHEDDPKEKHLVRQREEAGGAARHPGGHAGGSEHR